jgi:uncharacterized protein YuzE
MRADYDSEADAVSIDLIDAGSWNGGEGVDDDFCNVALADGRVANVSLLNPRAHLQLLEIAAERYELDADALVAAALAALAAPDRVVTVEVAAPAAA